jgi:hypothetical protein
MKNLKLPYKIILVSVGIALLLSIGLVASQKYVNKGDFAFVFGLACLAAGLLELVFGLILFASDSKEWRNGFLLSGAALLLLSGISCGSGAAFL